MNNSASRLEVWNQGAGMVGKMALFWVAYFACKLTWLALWDFSYQGINLIHEASAKGPTV